MRYFFNQGRAYIIGLDKPFLISIGTLIEAVEDEGFQVVHVYECEEYPGLPFAVPGECGEDWDWVGLVQRTAPSGSMEVPDQIKWIQEVPLPAPPPPAPGQPAPPPTEPPRPPAMPPPAPPAPELPVAKAAVRPLHVLLVLGGVTGGWLGARRIWGSK